MTFTFRFLSPAFWLVLSGVVAALHIGKLPAALPALEASLNISLVEAGFLLSLVQLAGVALGLVIGLTVEQLGLRRNLLLGLSLFVAASFFGSLATSAGFLMFFRAVEGLGFLLTVLPVPALLRRLVPIERLNFMLALWSCYMGAGVALALLAGPTMIELIGWEGWWLGLAAITLLVIAGVIFNVPSDKQLAEATQFTTEKPNWITNLTLTLKSLGPWIVAWCFGLYAGQWLTLIGFLPTIYNQVGFSANQIGLLTAFVALVNVFGNLLAGNLMQRGFLPQYLLFAGFLSTGIFTFIAFSSAAEANLWLGFVSVVLFSGLGGLIPSSLFALAVVVSPSDNAVSTTIGWMQQGSALGQLILPPLVAYFAAQVGGWHLTWVFTGLASLAGGLLALLLANRVKNLG